MRSRRCCRSLQELSMRGPWLTGSERESNPQNELVAAWGNSPQGENGAPSSMPKNDSAFAPEQISAHVRAAIIPRYRACRCLLGYRVPDLPSGGSELAY